MSLNDLRFDGSGLRYPAHRRHESEARLPEYLREAERILSDAAAADGSDGAHLELTEDFEHLRWFPLPDEIPAPWHRPAAGGPGTLG